MSVGLQGLAALTLFCLVLFCFCSEWLHFQLYRLLLSAIVFLPFQLYRPSIPRYLRSAVQALSSAVASFLAVFSLAEYA
jgi:uncharacterized membrane protein